MKRFVSVLCAPRELLMRDLSLVKKARQFGMQFAGIFVVFSTASFPSRTKEIRLYRYEEQCVIIWVPR
jgi:hypothetical protein